MDRLSELQRRLPRRPFERTQKMLHAVVAHRVADLVHAHIGFLQQLPRGGNAQGTGLGLAICSEVARRHDIRIDVASRVSAGTTFRFTFPDGGR